MHRMTFFPLGNADCCRIDLQCGKKILVDFAATREAEDEDDVRCDLPDELRRDLEEADRKHFEIVAFTHLDRDHFCRATEFFFLEHAQKYQDNERIRMDVMWVPAAFITEPGPEDSEARTLQKEARYRFKQKVGIRVFSRPERLKDWCDENGVDLDDRLDLITDAGQTAPEVSLAEDGLEVFVHSPFAVRQDQNTVEDRNGDCLVLHATFEVEGVQTKALLLGDATHESIEQIVNITEDRHSDDRLKWDITKIAHHCSYKALGPEKGQDVTEPVPDVGRLYREHGQTGGILVSTSKPIPSEGGAEDENSDPPHRQAAGYYAEAATELYGQFVVTMAHPSTDAPTLLVIEIDGYKATLQKKMNAAGYLATTQRPPRAGGA